MSGERAPLIEEHWFDDDGVVPNNTRSPLLVYRATDVGHTCTVRAGYVCRDGSNLG